MQRFNILDLFMSSRLALSPQRLLIQFSGLTVAYFCYYLLSVLGLLVAGLSLERVFSRGLLPFVLADGSSFNLVAKTILFLACALAACVLLVTNTATCRSTFAALKGMKVNSWWDSCRFALQKAKAILLTPLSIGLLCLLLICGSWLVGLLGRLPFIGELVVSLFSPVWIVASLTLLFLLLVGAVALVLGPAIIATTEGDAFEGVFQSFSTVWRQAARFLFYEAVVILLSAFGFLVAAVIAKRSFLLMNSLFVFSMGEKYRDLVSQAQHLLQSWMLSFDGLVIPVFGRLADYFYFSRDFAAVDGPITLGVSAALMAGSFLLLGGFLLAYFLATLNSGNVIAFIVLHRIKAGEDLLADQSNGQVIRVRRPSRDYATRHNNRGHEPQLTGMPQETKQ